MGKNIHNMHSGCLVSAVVGTRDHHQGEFNPSSRRMWAGLVVAITDK